MRFPLTRLQASAACLLSLPLTALAYIYALKLYDQFPDLIAFAKALGPENGASGALEWSLLISGPIYFAYWLGVVVSLVALVGSPIAAALAFWISNHIYLKKASAEVTNA